jgi:hypothetical protein
MIDDAEMCKLSKDWRKLGARSWAVLRISQHQAQCGILAFLLSVS